MARPRVFVSSTFYDLKYARAELEGFIRDMGFDPVLNERGHIPYGSTEALEKYCYNEIGKVHILVSIVGGRFGTKAHDSEFSISNAELSTAIKMGKQVYVFVESSVLSEYQTYLRNKSVTGIQYTHVDNPKVYEFLEGIYALPFNNQISGFDNLSFITRYLKEQWAGLFEQYLEQQGGAEIMDMLVKMESTTDTLRGLVELLKSQASYSQGAQVIKEQALDAIIIQNHPLFSVLRTKLYIRYRVFFTNIKEMEEWLRGSRGIKLVGQDQWDDKSIREYLHERDRNPGKELWLIKIPNDLFDDFGNLKPMLPGDWDDKRVTYAKHADMPPPASAAAGSLLDDEIPF
jgi:hypothetical protein